MKSKTLVWIGSVVLVVYGAGYLLKKDGERSARQSFEENRRGTEEFTKRVAEEEAERKLKSETSLLEHRLDGARTKISECQDRLNEYAASKAKDETIAAALAQQGDLAREAELRAAIAQYEIWIATKQDEIMAARRQVEQTQTELDFIRRNGRLPKPGEIVAITP